MKYVIYIFTSEVGDIVLPSAVFTVCCGVRAQLVAGGSWFEG